MLFLVTGGAGYVGSGLARRLLASGWRVLEVFPDLNNVQRIVIASPANP